MPDDNPYAYATDYRNTGWLGTLPLPYKCKEAPPGGFTGHGRPYPTVSQIENWLKRGSRNIALRLGDVAPGKARSVVYAGNVVDGWELLCIDVDHHDDKHGYAELLKLEAEYGQLPPTWCNSARWDTSTKHGHRIFLVPKGYHFKGKAADCIDIICKGMRYIVAPPSIHPDGNVYAWRYGQTGGDWQKLPESVVAPPLEYLAELPEAWFKYLLKGPAVEIDVSNLGASELLDWADATFADPGNMCAKMRAALDKHIADLNGVADCHPHLNDDTWHMLNLAAEGHSGWRVMLAEYVNTWIDHTGNARDTEINYGEISRAVNGALAKIKPKFEKAGSYLPDDTCKASVVDLTNFLDSDDVDRIAESDYNGLGPVVGPMDLYGDKPPDAYDMNDRGNAKHFIDLYGDDAKYVDSRKSWVLWSQGRWHRDMDEKKAGKAFERVARRQKQFASMLPANDKVEIGIRRTWTRWALSSGNASQIKNALNLAKQEYVNNNPVSLSGNEFDANPKLLGCSNGIVELEDEPFLRPPRKEDYVTYNTNIEYIPWDTNSANEAGVFEAFKLWNEYLDLFLPDPEIRHFVHKVFGHCLIGENPEKLLIFLYGPHDTGKSTMLGAMKAALGDYYGTVNRQLFTPKPLNPGLIRAVPLRVTGMSEIDAGIMDAATIKMLTGNDPVQAEAKYSNEIFEGRPQFTTLIACNNEPDIRHADEALNERILPLPFDNQIPRKIRKYERQTEIERESGLAVLSWLVEGWRLYCAEGLRPWPVEVRRLHGEIVGNFNSTQQFISECLEKATRCQEGHRALERAKRKAAGSGKTVPTVSDWDIEWTPLAGNVYQIYQRWCQTNGVSPPVPIGEFSKELGLGKPQNRSIEGGKPRCYLGVRIKE